MRPSKLVAPLAAAALAFALAAAAGASESQTFERVSLVDTMCIGKVKADPDKHTRACALQCKGSGYGILATDGRYLRFDAAGNEKAIAALKASDRKDTLRVDVTGTLDGEILAVETLTLVD
jgi:hypothetical protein